MDESLILYTTWPDAETARSLAAEAVAEGLAACANIFPGVLSVYRWQGAIEQASEVVMTLKTTAAAAPRLRDLILRRHPYETACVVAVSLNAAASSAAYLQWIGQEVTAPPAASSNKNLS